LINKSTPIEVFLSKNLSLRVGDVVNILSASPCQSMDIASAYQDRHTFAPPSKQQSKAGLRRESRA
jgi:hypothetical protein